MLPMNSRIFPLLLSVVLACLASSCLRPVEGDFPTHGHGLADDELLWVLRIPATPSDGDLGPVSTEDSIRFVRYNKPLFQSGLQNIIRRLLINDIGAYEEYPPKTLLENPRERLIQMGGTAQNLDPLLHVAELYVVVNTRQNYYQSVPKYLRLIWANPEGREADRGFAGLDLSGDWVRDIIIGEQDLAEFVTDERFFGLPVYLRTNFREYAIKNAEEARYVSKLVHEGRWRNIEWMANGINISGKKKIELKPETVAPLAGYYLFPFIEKSDSAVVPELYLTAENDYLIADWSNRFQIEPIMPFDPFRFFSISGEGYDFFVDEEEKLYLRVVQGKDTIWGIQSPED